LWTAVGGFNYFKSDGPDSKLEESESGENFILWHVYEKFRAVFDWR
jgi:hypothetical protein